MEGGDIFIQDFINDLQESPESQVQECFRNCCVLITGGTGFVGKVLIEKLLRYERVHNIRTHIYRGPENRRAFFNVIVWLFFRSCRDLNTIYVVARPLNGQTPNERVKKMFISPVIYSCAL